MRRAAVQVEQAASPVVVHGSMVVVRRRTSVVRALAVAIAVAVVVPLADLATAVARGAPLPFAFEEDAYYSFAVARSIGEGLGVTVDGEQLTSGFQPLWTFGLVPAFLLPGRASFAVVATISAVLWVAAAWTFGRLLGDLARPTRLVRREVELLATAVFAFDPGLRLLFFNGLETGLAVLLLLVAVRRVVLRPPPGRVRDELRAGALLGLLVLARVDAVLLVGGLLLARLVVHRPARLVRSMLVPGAVAAAMLAPWLLFSLLATGSAAPQGGVATSAGIYRLPLADHLEPAVDAAAAWLWWPLAPDWIPTSVMPWMGAALVGAATLAVARRRRLLHDRVGAGLVVLATAAAAVCAFYVVVSSAVWFYARYFAPLHVVVAVLAALVAVVALERTRRQWAVLGAVGLLAVATVVSQRGVHQPYQYDATATLATLDADSCAPVGMFESGRTAFAFPELVANLDGKTNADALDAFREDRLPPYLRRAGIDVLLVAPVWLEILDRHDVAWRDEFGVVADPLGSPNLFLVRHGTTCLATERAARRRGRPPTGGRTEMGGRSGRVARRHPAR